MKLCLSCTSAFTSDSWVCPVCQFTPQTIDNFHAFSPELSSHNDGLADDAHHLLDALQGKSFWFRERNQLGSVDNSLLRN